MALPDALLMIAYLAAPGMSEAVHACLDALASAGAPTWHSWQAPLESAPRTGSLDQALRRAAQQTPYTIRFNFGQQSAVSIYQAVNQSYWTARFFLDRDDPAFADVPLTLRLAAKALRSLLQTSFVYSAYLQRQGGGAHCLPLVPLAGSAYMVALDPQLVEKEYERPEVFWQAGWESVQTIGERSLVLRAMQAADSVDFLKAVITPQWDMARAARPGRTQYSAADPLPEEMPIYRACQRTLEPVGYAESLRLMEYSSYLDPDQHVCGWEIFALRDLIEDRALPDGRPVETVRVVFYTEEMAQREKRPLLDIGVHVHYESSAGELIEVP
jgi:hypothetical protein